MKISAIGKNYVNHNYPKKIHQQKYQNFEGKGKRLLGGILGGAAGGVAGGAIIGGGSLAGAALLAASGPVGWGLAAIYTVGGSILGSWIGSKIADNGDEGDHKNTDTDG